MTHSDMTTSGAMPLETSRGAHAAALAFVLLFPTAATWVWFVALAGAPSVQAVYGVAKVLQFAFPLVWIIAIQRQRLRLSPPGTQGIGLGLAFGAAVVGVMLVLYFVFLKSHPLLADAPGEVRAKLADFRAETPARFFVLAMFYSVVHAFLEEYYWRWFAFGQLRRVVSVSTAVSLSSLAFMSHHVIVVGMYLGPNWLAVGFFSFSVAVGGAFWAWLYHRTGSLIGPWLSHLLVDAGIMLLGYEMIWGLAPKG